MAQFPLLFFPLLAPLCSPFVFFSFGFLCSKEHFSIFFVQYLGVTVGIEPAT
jgi:hypothetical protein